MHGWGIAQRIRQVSGDLLQLNQGTLYPALLRVEQKGWISSEWKITENNRRAKYYSLTSAGKKQLEAETLEWERFAGVMARMLSATE
jgi:transcriptional regulator